MSTEGQETADGADPLDDAPLWDLLGRQSPPVKVSPYFARRVLREIARDEESGGGGWWAHIWPLRMPAPRYLTACTGAFACVVLGLATLVSQPSHHHSATVNHSAPAATATTVNPPDAAAPVDQSAPATDSVVSTESADANQDVEVIADLDNILDREESRLWTEDTARF